ncbi:hypothetical protein PB2503_04132 [Parvularcula bermudensis HTCC2503]|uniref:DNA translocase FtsK n=1 Tax=Parvularcula bermudensis (strain ATCC BAA-594 / HTCC2503 / KCTC 12087) TaxID=314260 RepID=E0TEL8_PARBH|nr:DNA translocase FtsK 4TM domain-containing protein [Parvularcula bermudensis]ADM08901.1 hypothetical protein PB2503_04132 [Parvularcula bermudensis HTCC2503]
MPVRKSNDDIAETAMARAAFGLRALLVRCGALALLVLAGFVWISVASFAVSDPSWANATARQEIANWGGAAGANVAVVLLQLFGGASLLLPVVPAVWGWEALRFGIPRPTPISAWLKGAAWAGGTMAMSAFAALLPRAADWPFTTSMGGLLGSGLRGVVGPLLSLPLATVFVAMIALSLATVLSFFAAGWRRDHVEAGLDAFFYCYDAVRDWTLARWDWLKERMDDGRWSPLARFIPSLSGAKEADLAAETLEKLGVDPTAEETGAEEDWAEEDWAETDTAYDEERDDDAYDAPEEDAASGRRRIVREVKKVPPRRPVSQPELFHHGDFAFPSISFLKAPNPDDHQTISEAELNRRARLLEGVLADFKVNGEIINVRPGPVVTLYELEPAAGVKSSRVIGLADDIARSMSAIACRVAVVPGRNAIGIELPNDNREIVLYQEMLTAEGFHRGKGLTLALGKDIGGEPQYADLTKMPHLLIAGTTGSGKSVGINTMILSLLYRLPPDQCKLIMVDPKMLELSVYEGIPHLLAPVVTDPRKAVVALKWTVKEMEQRYHNMSKLGVRNIHGFNERIDRAEERGEELTRRDHAGYDPETGDPIYEEEVLDFERMPYIVVVIDEVADLMMVAGKDIEGMVQRLAQMARAAGIHLIMATQRPSVDVITGTIKANFPTRISFQVTSKIDSRTILGEQGAEQLLGQGDMLYMAGGGRVTRIHGAFVSDDEVEAIVGHLKKQGKPSYVQEVTEGDDDEGAASLGLSVGGNTSSGDALFDQAVAIIARDRKASTSYIQRRLQIGYNRAASLMEQLEEEGIVGPANHAGKREILVGEEAA